MFIRLLHENDVSAYRSMRLDALRDSPTAFRSSYEEEIGAPLEKFALVLREPAIFGAFAEEGQLIGLVGCRRESRGKLAHNALIVGVHVKAAHRRQGVGGALLDHVIQYAQQLGGIRMLKLSVTANNQDSIRLCVSRGFKSYGLEPDALCVDGAYYAEELYYRRLENSENNGSGI
jgi:RimJ/RimL family protein N-acetyltransferase